MTQQERYDQLMLKWLNRELSDEEMKELHAMPEFSEYEHIVEVASSWKKPTWNQEQEFVELEERKNQRKKGKVIFLKPLYYGLAASIMIGFFFFLNQGTETVALINYTTAFGEQHEVKLPDNSRIKLNALSGIELDTLSWLENRHIALQGEAYFDVEKGSTFSVDFNAGKLFVRGTTFNIKSRAGSFVVECYEGKVVVYEGLDSLILTKGHSAAFDGEGGLVPGTFDKDKPSWFGGISTFKAEKLSVVLAELEAQFGIKIISDKIDLSRKFTGSFTHKDLDAAFKMVCTPMGIDYKIEGKKVFLSRKQ